MHRPDRSHTAAPATRNTLTCTRCGHSVALDADLVSTVDEALAGHLGYELASHRLELFGCCASCRTLGVPAGVAWGHA